MEVHRHSDPAYFLERARPWLLRAEVENNLILGIAGALPGGATPPHGPQAPYLATVEDGSQVLACALRTPPHKVVLTRADDPAAIDCLAEDLAVLDPALPMVFGPEAEARRFAERWSGLRGGGGGEDGAPARRGTAQRLFSTARVDAPARRPPGRMRAAAAADLPTLISWIQAFTGEAGGQGVSDPVRFARERVQEGAMFVWEDGAAVSMAACLGRTPRGIRISLVYTPPERRARGYASACVADLTQRLLDQGLAYCCLFTDLANPTSNRIYQAIGYRPVCDMTDYHLAEARPGKGQQKSPPAEVA